MVCGNYFGRRRHGRPSLYGINPRPRPLRRSLYPRIRRCPVLKKICNDETSPCPRLVLLYARMGLHPYNLFHGPNLQLCRVKKYNMSTGSAAATYDITLEANDLGLQTFETSVSESSFGQFVLSCKIAIPLGVTIDVGKGTGLGKNMFLVNTIPEWPSENPFKNSKRCYVLSKSELQDNDWIRLYLELAVATTNRGTIDKHDLSNLKIVKVAIDTTPQDVDVEFNRKHVTIVYIRYKDSCEARVGKDVDRVAIVRRAFTEQLGYFSLVGKTLSLESIQKKGKNFYQKKGGNKQREQLPVCLRLKRRLLSSPKRLKAYKYSHVGLSRRLRQATFKSVD